MTQAQALTAATWTVRDSDQPPAPDRNLKNLFLANTIALGFGPRSLDEDSRLIWQLIAVELDESPIADYPTVADYSMNARRYLDIGQIPPAPPGYEFWAGVGVDDSDVEMFSSELRNLMIAHRDDMPTMFLQQLCVHFGAADASALRESFILLLLHAGFTMKTISEDTENVSDDERNQRIDLACEFEGRLLAQAKRMRDLSERFDKPGVYGVRDDND